MSEFPATWVPDDTTSLDRYHCWTNLGNCCGHVEFVPEGPWWIAATKFKTFRAATKSDAQEIVERAWKADR